MRNVTFTDSTGLLWIRVSAESSISSDGLCPWTGSDSCVSGSAAASCQCCGHSVKLLHHFFLPSFCTKLKTFIRPSNQFFQCSDRQLVSDCKIRSCPRCVWLYQLKVPYLRRCNVSPAGIDCDSVNWDCNVWFSQISLSSSWFRNLNQITADLWLLFTSFLISCRRLTLPTFVFLMFIFPSFWPTRSDRTQSSRADVFTEHHLLLFVMVTVGSYSSQLVSFHSCW